MFRDPKTKEGCCFFPHPRCHFLPKNTLSGWFVPVTDYCGLFPSNMLLLQEYSCLRQAIGRLEENVNFCIYIYIGHPAAYGAPGPGIRSEPQLLPMPQLWQCQIPNPLCWARDQTYIPALPRHCQSCCITAGAPKFLSFKIKFCVCLCAHKCYCNSKCTH